MQAPRKNARIARLPNCDPHGLARATCVRIAVVGPQTQAEREAAAAGVEAIARRVRAALAGARGLDGAPAVPGLMGLQLEGHAAGRQRAAGKAPAEAHAPARMGMPWHVDRDARLGVETDVRLRGESRIAHIGAVGDAVAPRGAAGNPELEAPIRTGGDRAAI